MEIFGLLEIKTIKKRKILAKKALHSVKWPEKNNIPKWPEVVKIKNNSCTF